MINTNLKQRASLLFIGLMLVSTGVTASAVNPSQAIAFQDPSASWGGWARGDAETSFAHWAHIDSLLDMTPDEGNIGTNTAALITNNAGAFLTGGGAGGNIYSFGDTPDFTVVVGTDYAAPSDFVTVALQLKILGTDLDSSSVKLGGAAWDSTQTLYSGLAGGPFGGQEKEYLFVWDHVAADVAYSLDFLATGSSMSLDEVSVDIGVSAVPLPAAAWMFLSALSGLAVTRRKVNMS